MKLPETSPQPEASSEYPAISAIQLLALAGVALLAAIFHELAFDGIFNPSSLGIGFLFYVVILVVGWMGLSVLWKKQVNGQTLFLLAPLMFFAVMVFVRASPPLTFLNVLWCFFLLLVMARISYTKRLDKLGLGDYFWMFLLPFSFLAPVIKTLSDLLNLGGRVGDQSRLREVLRGVVMAIPFLIVFSLLFISADERFSALFSGLSTFSSGDAFFWVLVVGILTVFYLGAFSYVFRTQPGSSSENHEPGLDVRSSPVEGATLLGTISALFLLFSLIQLNYLFGGTDNIHTDGFTYAEYARRGFAELLAVGVISFFLLLLTEKAVLGPQRQPSPLFFRLVSAFLVLQVLLIMVSAIHRLFLYEQAYGLTSSRLYGLVFIAFLASAFLWLSAKITRPLSDQRFALGVFVLTIVFLGGLNLLNPDAFIAQRNIDRYQQTGKLDSDYFQRLSADIVPVVVPLLESEDLELRGMAASAMQEIRSGQHSPQQRSDSPMDYHLAIDRANREYRENEATIRQIQLERQESQKNRPSYEDSKNSDAQPKSSPAPDETRFDSSELNRTNEADLYEPIR